MNWSERKKLKQARELLAGARKLLRMNRDILEKRRMEEVQSVCVDLGEALARTEHHAAVPPLAERLERLLERTFPRPKHAGIRENVEVLLVAVIVAMAVRSFFLQPFKIPTGSMQPTLYGIHEDPNCDRNASIVRRFAETIFLGKTYSLAGCQRRGDHIFVDRFTYHFRKPSRGEVVVFDTAHIPDIPEGSRGKFYIKRLIGLPGDTVEVRPPHVLVNGDVLDSRKAFERIYSLENDYHGYVLPESSVFYGTPARFINSRARSYTVPREHLFVLGDNSRSSLDGRFWGSLPQRDLVGRAVFVYWPFTKRFGLID